VGPGLPGEAAERERRRTVSSRRATLLLVVVFYVPVGAGLGVGLVEHSAVWGLVAFGTAVVALTLLEVVAATMGGLGLLLWVLRHRDRG